MNTLEEETADTNHLESSVKRKRKTVPSLTALLSDDERSGSASSDGDSEDEWAVSKQKKGDRIRKTQPVRTLKKILAEKTKSLKKSFESVSPDSKSPANSKLVTVNCSDGTKPSEQTIEDELNVTNTIEIAEKKPTVIENIESAKIPKNEPELKEEKTDVKVEVKEDEKQKNDTISSGDLVTNIKRDEANESVIILSDDEDDDEPPTKSQLVVVNCSITKTFASPLLAGNETSASIPGNAVNTVLQPSFHSSSLISPHSSTPTLPIAPSQTPPFTNPPATTNLINPTPPSVPRIRVNPTYQVSSACNNIYTSVSENVNSSGLLAHNHVYTSVSETLSSGLPVFPVAGNVSSPGMLSHNNAFTSVGANVSQSGLPVHNNIYSVGTAVSSSELSGLPGHNNVFPSACAAISSGLSGPNNVFPSVGAAVTSSGLPGPNNVFPSTGLAVSSSGPPGHNNVILSVGTAVSSSGLPAYNVYPPVGAPVSSSALSGLPGSNTVYSSVGTTVSSSGLPAYNVYPTVGAPVSSAGLPAHNIYPVGAPVSSSGLPTQNNVYPSAESVNFSGQSTPGNQNNLLPQTPPSVPRMPGSVPRTPMSVPRTPTSVPRTRTSFPRTPKSSPRTPNSIPRNPDSAPRSRASSVQNSAYKPRKLFSPRSPSISSPVRSNVTPKRTPVRTPSTPATSGVKNSFSQISPSSTTVIRSGSNSVTIIPRKKSPERPPVQRKLFKNEIEGVIAVRSEDGVMKYVLNLANGTHLPLTTLQVRKLREQNNGTLPKTLKIPVPSDVAAQIEPSFLIED